MMGRHPPKVATWLLQRLGAGRHSESLAGDLIEQYAEGRGRLWYWQQVALAILLARARAFRARPWTAAMRVLLRLLTEVAVVLGVVSIIDQSRQAHDWKDMLSPAFMGTMAFLIAVALVGLLLSLATLRSKRPSAPINHLIVLFAVAALGAGTLSWASATRQCRAETCLCRKIEQRSITAEGHQDY
jgi:hypothetical protein